MDIRQRLHLSGMDSHAPELARKWGLGLEVTDFCYAPMLDDPATLPAVHEKMAGIDHFWLHAPFAELAPCAVDPLVREVTARRYRQALSAARQLGIRRLVIHSGYIPLVYFPEWFTEQSVAFWREFLPEVPEDMVLALENVMDETPQLMTDIVRQVDDPRLGLCLDVGHANPCASRCRSCSAPAVPIAPPPFVPLRSVPPGTGGNPSGNGAGNAGTAPAHGGKKKSHPSSCVYGENSVE